VAVNTQKPSEQDKKEVAVRLSERQPLDQISGLFSKVNNHPANDLVILHFINDIINFVKTTGLHDWVNLAFSTELEGFG
jgi:hypothetical protein